jgi:hypothetical protein
MTKRKKISAESEAEVLIRSRRRCCICFGLDQDLDVKIGQIAHLDHDPSNDKLDNLAWLCLPHHAQYDSTSPQSKGISVREAKRYRDTLYESIATAVESTWPTETDLPRRDVPLLSVSRPVGPLPGVPIQGIQLADDDFEDGAPWLYLQFHFKRSRFFGRYVPVEPEKWLYIEANMRPALNLRIQVRAWTARDTEDFMRFLRRGGRGHELHGPQPGMARTLDETLSSDPHAGDYLHVWEEQGERRLLISTFTATNAGISIHARLAEGVAHEIAHYLENAGFPEEAERDGS